MKPPQEAQNPNQHAYRNRMASFTPKAGGLLAQSLVLLLESMGALRAFQGRASRQHHRGPRGACSGPVAESATLPALPVRWSDLRKTEN